MTAFDYDAPDEPLSPGEWICIAVAVALVYALWAIAWAWAQRTILALATVFSVSLFGLYVVARLAVQ